MGQHKLEYMVISYTNGEGSLEKAIGVVLFEKSGTRLSFVTTRFMQDTQILKEFDPDIDLELIQASIHDIQQNLANEHERDDFLKMMQDNFSNALCVSDSKAVLSDNPDVEANNLAATLLR
jgi:hypothetical protein